MARSSSTSVDGLRCPRVLSAGSFLVRKQPLHARQEEDQQAAQQLKDLDRRLRQRARRSIRAESTVLAPEEEKGAAGQWESTGPPSHGQPRETLRSETEMHNPSWNRRFLREERTWTFKGCPVWGSLSGGLGLPFALGRSWYLSGPAPSPPAATPPRQSDQDAMHRDAMGTSSPWAKLEKEDQQIEDGMRSDRPGG